MALEIVQSPISPSVSISYNPTPIGQQIIFAVKDDPTVATKYKVKFVAEVHVSTEPIILSNDDARIGIFKTTPNNKGVGIFDLRPVLETFVKADYEGSTFGNGSRYKDSEVPHPIHLIDKYAMSENAIRFMAINFYVEYSDDPNGTVSISTDSETSDQYTIFNGVLQYDDVLTLSNGNYGYDLFKFGYDGFFLADTGDFLSNAPSTQYARLTDYGTLPFLNFLPTPDDIVANIVITYYWDGGSSTQTVPQSWTNGGLSKNTSEAYKNLMYFGCFPANLQNWSTTAVYGASSFETAIANGLTHYTMIANSEISTTSQMTTINIICPNLKGYEGIRLAWLNQWGTWDYYTFTMKSTRTTSTKRIPYNQQGGTWNESTFKISGWKGGKKNFRVNSTEKIKLNTDFVTEAEGVWFEELINSPEVYIVNEFESGDDTATITNKYIEPVVLTTSSYIKKTIANDKLMQYTFEIEKSKMQRTQAV
jgi:hypothetical protein